MLLLDFHLYWFPEKTRHSMIGKCRLHLPSHIHTSQYDIKLLRMSDNVKALPEIEFVLGV